MVQTLLRRRQTGTQPTGSASLLAHLADAITTAHLAQLGGSEATATISLTLLLILTTIWPHETWQLTLHPHSDQHLMATAARITRWWPRQPRNSSTPSSTTATDPGAPAHDTSPPGPTTP